MHGIPSEMLQRVAVLVYVLDVCVMCMLFVYVICVCYLCVTDLPPNLGCSPWCTISVSVYQRCCDWIDGRQSVGEIEKEIGLAPTSFGIAKIQK